MGVYSSMLVTPRLYSFVAEKARILVLEAGQSHLIFGTGSKGCVTSAYFLVRRRSGSPVMPRWDRLKRAISAPSMTLVRSCSRPQPNNSIVPPAPITTFLNLLELALISLATS